MRKLAVFRVPILPPRQHRSRRRGASPAAKAIAANPRPRQIYKRQRKAAFGGSSHQMPAPRPSAMPLPATRMPRRGKSAQRMHHAAAKAAITKMRSANACIAAADVAGIGAKINGPAAAPAPPPHRTASKMSRNHSAARASSIRLAQVVPRLLAAGFGGMGAARISSAMRITRNRSGNGGKKRGFSLTSVKGTRLNGRLASHGITLKIINSERVNMPYVCRSHQEIMYRLSPFSMNCRRNHHHTINARAIASAGAAAAIS